MEARPNFFPVYVSGQYLTSELLNETHNFLWQEEKATRYLLDGNGIVTGLNADFSDNTLLKQVTITAGDASTVDGYLIQAGAQTFDKGLSINLSWLKLPNGSQQIMEKTQYDKVKANLNASETVLSAIEIFLSSAQLKDLPDGTKTVDTFAISSSAALSNYLVLAWVYINDQENDHCQQGDCNTKGIQRNYITRYFLIQNNLFPSANSVSPEMPLCIAARIKNLSQAGSSTGLYQSSYTAWGVSYAELQPYFSTNVTGKQLGIITTLLGTDEQTALTSAITKFGQINSSVNATNCPQYYNAFASDLSRAVNELVSFYNDYAKKYPIYSHDRIEQTIILGSFRQTGIDKWRYYFIPAEEQTNFTFDRKRLSALLMRAVSLVNNFLVSSTITATANKVAKVLAIPSLMGDALLQNHAIPYYYDVLQGGAANAVIKYWNPQGGNLQNIFCFYDSINSLRNNNPNMAAKLSTADWSGDNFFRIEGHIGLTKDAAMSAINALIVNDGLPIQVLDCDVNYKGPIKWIDWYTKFSGFLKDSLVALKNNPNTKSYAYDPLKKIQTLTVETSYRKPDEVKSILDDFTAYNGVFYNTKATAAAPKAKRAAATGTGKTTSITQPVIDNYKNVVTQQKVTDLLKEYNDAVVAVKDPAAKKLIVLKDLAGLEYMGGVPRGGTFILLHSGGTVIGDGCLSYYYRIDQGRIFD